MNREEKLRLIDAKIALAETELKILQAMVDRELCMRFAVLFAQKLCLITDYAECKACRRRLMLPEVCLESRLKTGKCILEVGIEKLENYRRGTRV